MATAPSRRDVQQARLHVERHMRDAQSASGNFDRSQVAIMAMQSPQIKALVPLSPAWYAALRMLYCYAAVRTENEGYYFQLFLVHTVEEVAERQMWLSNYSEEMSPRVYGVAALAALHSLNWARQNPDDQHNPASA